MKRTFLLCTALIAFVLAEGPALARHRLSFVPGRHGYAMTQEHSHWRSHGGGRRHYGSRSAAGRGSSRHGNSSDDSGGTVTPPPGSGFKMEDGVLTYPAPARFQPQNLPHLH